MKGRGLLACGRLMALVGLALASSACATVVGGTTQEVFVETDPPAAACKLDQQGANVGVVNPTPGRLKVARSKEIMVVSCPREGYEQSNEVLASSFTGATIGNIILGGVVGIIVDAASGANNKYPDKVIVVMTPSSFPNVAARDTYYDGVKARLNEQATAEIKRIAGTCSSTNRERCRIDEKKITDARDKALADIDSKRAAAKVVPTS